ncbi:ATP-binding protein [Pseudomonas sp. Marseille-Q5115]|uniref:ATP-binding protein n=1 Tax=Pseudomonas sp. Marseille-Q5115 TaxID=2866593 RepID=UPI001CE40CA1|nr:AAA family ATPase [Pseudomonas sp. Marseille-Q5115]
MTFHYPLSAVVGAEPLKLALCLAAIDPKIGGVLIEGPRGMAKSTLARGLADLLEGAPFVTLPLGASEDRVAGTLDLDAALGQGQVRFSPGVLAAADGGVLYVDEVNLLPDPLVDLLLDVAASGVNRVERDGISHQHPSRFVLIGTMNPEEGELRPQLLDRFGLNVALEQRPEPAERQAIIRRRLAFDSDPAGFCEQWASEQANLGQRCREARARLNDIPLDDAALASISEACHASGVDGLRADLVWLRAARAHAAWRGGAHIEGVDIEAVAEFALRHRRQSPAPLTPPASSSAPQPQQPQQPQQGASGDWGQMPAQTVATGPRTGLPGWPKKH